MNQPITVTTAAAALTALRTEARDSDYDFDEASASDVASRITGFDPYGRPLAPSKETLNLARRELAKLVRDGEIVSRVLKVTVENRNFTGRHPVRYKLFSTLLRTP